jgi:predicted trehalose synthase
MLLNFKRTIIVVAAITLLWTGSTFASAPVPAPGAPEKERLGTYLSVRASTLLAEIQNEAAQLTPHAETLQTYSRTPGRSWQSHAEYLQGIKDHINAVGERLAELHRIRDYASPWQQKAITEVTSHAAQVAASTQAAIVHLRENQDRLFVPEYRDHLKTIADRSRDMKQTVDRYLDYEETQQKLRRLQIELEIVGD